MSICKADVENEEPVNGTDLFINNKSELFFLLKPWQLHCSLTLLRNNTASASDDVYKHFDSTTELHSSRSCP
jgi:hypothetical protein